MHATRSNTQQTHHRQQITSDKTHHKLIRGHKTTSKVRSRAGKPSHDRSRAFRVGFLIPDETYKLVCVFSHVRGRFNSLWMSLRVLWSRRNFARKALWEMCAHVKFACAIWSAGETWLLNPIWEEVSSLCMILSECIYWGDYDIDILF